MQANQNNSLKKDTSLNKLLGVVKENVGGL
jgi:hypothetical protein